MEAISKKILEFLKSKGNVRYQDIKAEFPFFPKSTITRALKHLLANGKIETLNRQYKITRTPKIIPSHSVYTEDHQEE